MVRGSALFRGVVKKLRALFKKHGIRDMEEKALPDGTQLFFHVRKTDYGMRIFHPIGLALGIEWDRPAVSIVLCRGVLLPSGCVDLVMLDLEYAEDSIGWTFAYKAKDHWDGQLSKLARRYGVRTIRKRYPLPWEQAFRRAEEVIRYYLASWPVPAGPPSGIVY